MNDIIRDSDWQFYWVTDGLSPHKREYYIAGDYEMYKNINAPGFSVYVYGTEQYLGQADSLTEATAVVNGSYDLI